MMFMMRMMFVDGDDVVVIECFKTNVYTLIHTYFRKQCAASRHREFIYFFFFLANILTHNLKHIQTLTFIKKSKDRNKKKKENNILLNLKNNLLNNVFFLFFNKFIRHFQYSKNVLSSLEQKYFGLLPNCLTREVCQNEKEINIILKI